MIYPDNCPQLSHKTNPTKSIKSPQPPFSFAFQVQWRLNAFARNLASEDLPRPFLTPYVPGLTVLIPHYGEQILLRRRDLEIAVANAGEEVPLIAWLEKRPPGSSVLGCFRDFRGVRPGIFLARQLCHEYLLQGPQCCNIFFTEVLERGRGINKHGRHGQFQDRIGWTHTTIYHL